jgi:hypothetical protein
MNIKDFYQVKTNITNTSDSVQDKLDRLSRLGRTQLSHIKDGWYCSLEIQVLSSMTMIRIHSGFGHKSACAAIDDCITQVRKVQQALEIPA